MNEEIPSGNFEESVHSDAGRADDISKVLLSPSTTDESCFNLENTKICFTRHGIWIIDSGDNTKTTLLHAAAGFGDIESVRYLLEQDVDVNITDERGLTPLHNCVHHNHYAIAELLVEQGASVNREDVWGITPLHLASGVKDWNIYQLLLKGSDQLAGMQPCPSVIPDMETSQTPELPSGLVGIKGTNVQQAGINRDPPFKSRGVIVGNEQSVTEDFTRVGQHGTSASSCQQANIPTQILEFTSAQLPLANMIEKSVHRGSASIQSFSRHFSDTLMNKPFASPMSPRPAFNTSLFRSPFSNESSHLRTSHHESSLYPGKTKFGGHSSVSFLSQRNVDLS
ncbi:poly [ADP-ribose] polymerase tankyrase-2-like isoform X2 [Mercenaria mercenaria]|uniref:poly [ADP-ribose] polymerase tankyrase-2-like isoform X2 n=1 Tax=Mercenaria mercenaria TaxID=6596 RepID=UPI00234E55C0|nr:poly [ADP-ribose] polymerase tankyrase-2-like isoform X2 [Mercenaria mercenaria]